LLIFTEPRAAIVDRMTAPLRTSLLYDDPGALIAAIPGLLGFHPDDSAVLITYTGARRLDLESVLRIDLPSPDHIADVAHQLCLVAVNHQAVVVDLIVLGGPNADPPHRLPSRDLVTELSTLFEAHKITLAHAVWAHRPTSGRMWWCYSDPDCTGQIHNPTTSPLVAALTTPGVPTRRNRAELVALLTPDPEDRLAPRTALIAALPKDPTLETEYAFLRTTIDTLPNPTPNEAPESPSTHGPRSESGSHTAPNTESHPGSESHCTCGTESHVDSVSGPTPEPDPDQESDSTHDPESDPAPEQSWFGCGPEPDLDDPTIARLARALSIPDIREACLAFPLTPRAAQAERLWAALTRTTPAPFRANPACLLAISTYLRGEGTLASIALDLAEAADPTHHLTHTLREVVDLGLPPRRFRLMLAESIVASLTDDPPDPEPPNTPTPNTPAATPPSTAASPTHADAARPESPEGPAPNPPAPDPTSGRTTAFREPRDSPAPQSLPPGPTPAPTELPRPQPDPRATPTEAQPGSRHLALAHTNPKHATGPKHLATQPQPTPMPWHTNPKHAATNPDNTFSQWEQAMARRRAGPEYQARHRAA
jgi:hypothetical protein